MGENERLREWLWARMKQEERCRRREGARKTLLLSLALALGAFVLTLILVSR